LNLEPVRTTATSALLARQFTLPDVYGVFTLRVNYKRTGYTYIDAKDVIAVRPFQHDEYPRFLPSAWPYYATSASVMLAFVAFSGAWMWSAPPKPKQKTE